VYEVTLTVESTECGTLSTVLHICIGDEGGFGTPNCQAFFFFSQPDPANLLTFQFIELPLGAAETLLWNFGDGNTSTEPNPLHTYATAGTYNVTLTVTAGECTSTVLIPVQTGDNVWYGDDGCRAWFLPIINPNTSQVYFVNLSSADAIEFAWDFGDGETSTDPLALHTYAEPGTYTATLTITSASGCINVFSATIDVAGGGFTGNPIFALISSTEEPTQLSALTVAPNPTRDVALVSWQPTQAGGYTWQLSDLSGRTVANGKGQATAGLETLDVDMRALPAGLYQFRLQTADGWQTMRLSKL
jgi:chitodextrinase